MMKDIFLFVFIFFLVFISCSTHLDDENTPVEVDVNDIILEDSGKEWLDNLCSDSFAGRKAGTVGNRLAFEYLCHEIEMMGYKPESQIFQTKKGSTIRNIIVNISGESDSIVIVGAHFDGAHQSDDSECFQAAEDNASGVVSLMMLLRHIQMEPFVDGKKLICCFWDCEERFEGNIYQGSNYFANHLADSIRPHILYYINLDNVGHDHGGKNEIYLDYNGSELTKRIVENTAMNRRFRYFTSRRDTFTSDYASFYNVGIPFICYHDHDGSSCNHPNHSTMDTKDAISIKRLVKVAHNIIDQICF